MLVLPRSARRFGTRTSSSSGAVPPAGSVSGPLTATSPRVEQAVTVQVVIHRDRPSGGGAGHEADHVADVLGIVEPCARTPPTSPGRAAAARGGASVRPPIRPTVTSAGSELLLSGVPLGMSNTPSARLRMTVPAGVWAARGAATSSDKNAGRPPGHLARWASANCAVPTRRSHAASRKPIRGPVRGSRSTRWPPPPVTRCRSRSRCPRPG